MRILKIPVGATLCFALTLPNNHLHQISSGGGGANEGGGAVGGGGGAAPLKAVAMAVETVAKVTQFLMPIFSFSKQCCTVHKQIG
jgi:hypothetical protein